MRRASIALFSALAFALTASWLVFADSSASAAAFAVLNASLPVSENSARFSALALLQAASRSVVSTSTGSGVSSLTRALIAAFRSAAALFTLSAVA